MEWISVTKELPEELGEYLTRFRLDGFSPSTMIARWYPVQKVWAVAQCEGVVTHWMPLPAPPKLDSRTEHTQ